MYDTNFMTLKCTSTYLLNKIGFEYVNGGHLPLSFSYFISVLPNLFLPNGEKKKIDGVLENIFLQNMEKWICTV